MGTRNITYWGYKKATQKWVKILRKHTQKQNNNNNNKRATLPKRLYEWQIGAWKDAEQQQPLRKCKLKPWNTTTPLKWLIKQILTVSSADEAADQLELSYFARENIKWYSHSGKVWQFLIKWNIHLPHDPQSHWWVFHLREMKTSIHKNLYRNVYGRAIYNCSKLQTT